MKILSEKMAIGELRNAENVYNDEMVKAVVDVGRETIGVDAEMHADIEQLLLSEGGNQDDLWGINLYPDGYDEEGIVEFDSMINVRPRLGNRSRSVESEELQRIIREVVAKWLY